MGLAFLIWRPAFIDLDGYYLEAATGRAELPETAGGVFVLHLADGQRLGLPCEVNRGRRGAAVQRCVEDAFDAGLRNGKIVTVRYLRPPRKAWDHPVLLSIGDEAHTYLPCPDRLRVLELRGARYADALCADAP